jgi:hypothetical protein
VLSFHSVECDAVADRSTGHFRLSSQKLSARELCSKELGVADEPLGRVLTTLAPSAATGSAAYDTHLLNLHLCDSQHPVPCINMVSLTFCLVTSTASSCKNFINYPLLFPDFMLQY